MAAASEPARYEDLFSLPQNVTGQIVGGELHVHPHPAARHALAASALGEELGPPFKRGKGGPGGWIILDEPELHLSADILVPDLAGWRRERMPDAREGVRRVWIVEPESKTLEVLRLDGDGYRIVLVASDDDKGHYEPFDAIEVDVAILWAR